MFRLVQSSPVTRIAAATQRAPVFSRLTNASTRRALSDSTATSSRSSGSSPLAGDSGHKATHLHHHMTTFLAVTTPVYLLSPSTYTDGLVDQAFGVVLAASIAGHSWIGLSYVATDYVPKISKGLMGPARLVAAGIGALTFVGLSKIALNGQGGVKGTMAALWRPKEATPTAKGEE